MKRALYSLLLTALLSCGKTAEESHRVIVHSSYGNTVDGYLYSVSDKALVIDLPTSSDLVDDDMYRRTIMFDTISYVEPLDEPQAVTPIALGIVGCFAGGLIGSEIDPRGSEIVSNGAVIGALAGAAAGTSIGILLNNMEKQLTPRKPGDMQYIRSIARERSVNPTN